MVSQNKHQKVRKSWSRRLSLAIIPHSANDYQPHLIRRYGLIAVLLCIVLAQLAYNASQAGSILGDNANVSVDALLSEANKERKKHGLESLSIDTKLSYAAQLKSSNMFEEQYWGHDSPDGTKPWKWLVDAEYAYTKAGENLAKNFYTAEAVNAAWMNSPDHRKNILDPDYTEVGFAVESGTLDGKATTIVVALYGRPAVTGVTSANAAVETARSSSIGVLERLGVGMQSMTPAALGSIIVIVFMMTIAFSAHLYRDFISAAVDHPRHRRNHGAIKMSLMFVLIVAMLLLYGGGQI